ncbi:uncharacterized protein LOC122065181 [Macadamia integrifolia]|uniref:uncharacterized protein LOC122065181 n=1 Tax=Macadamia integrifolia TaxID=60698 RepID=UPI001C4EC359|nr:uncharacterized protein LOC122065181 [Macadamia integrifolia]
MGVEEGKSVASTTPETHTPTPSDSAQTLPSDPLPPSSAVPPAVSAPPAVSVPPAVSAPTAVTALPAVSTPPAVVGGAAASVQNKKRKLEDGGLHNSTYFKIRAVVKDLRPFFIEVLQTPDFRNCKAATEIRKKMKVMMDLYKQMTMERISMAKCKNSLDGQTLSSETKEKQKPAEKRQVEKRAEHHKADKIPEKSSGGKHPPGGNSQKLEDARVQGTYVVGGSPCGWNFIMYPGSKPVYYGVTKESRQVAK